MSRIAEDKNGKCYDLTQVCYIEPIPQESQSGNVRIPAPPLTKLHFENGSAQSTLLPFEELRAQWIAVKQAEGHPADVVRENLAS